MSVRPAPAPMRGRVLVIAGSDSGGGAGIQADIKAITALGAYAETAITALTAQDTRGVRAVHAVPEAFVALQISMALDDPGADTIKTGMLGSAAMVVAVAEALRDWRGPFVLDPVMLAKGGAKLLEDGAVVAVRERLVPLASLLTPNIPEAEALSGERIDGLADQRRVAVGLLKLGARAVLLKGGHGGGDELVDVLATESGVVEFRSPRLNTRHTHGTGCTLASAIAAGLAQGMVLGGAVTRGLDYVRAAIAAAPGYGEGHGPLNHAVSVHPGWLPPG